MVPVEWSEAQELLLKLVHTLTPWTGREVPPSFFLSKRFAVPFEVPPLRSFVTLLTTLRSAQEFVNEWVGEGENLDESDFPSQARKAASFTNQAQRMIDEVQKAISSMVYSANLKDPKEEPLRAALKRLRPHLAELIEAVNNEGIHSTYDPPAPSRFALPPSQREHLLRRIAQKGEKGRWEVEEKKGEGRPLSLRLQLNEKMVLSALPFIPPMKNLPSSGKKKKKRKSFWFREEKPDEESR